MNPDFPAYTDLGGYPIIYVTQSNDVLCADCAACEDERPTSGIHYEGPAYNCDECNAKILSAYGEENF